MMGVGQSGRADAGGLVCVWQRVPEPMAVEQFM